MVATVRHATLGVLATLAAVLAVGAGLWALGSPAAADDRPATERTDGRDRFETAANIARTTFDVTDTAFVATGEDYPDALAASFAAGISNGPILLAQHEQVPQATLDALDELNVQRVVLMGGEAVLAPEVDAQLHAEGYEVVRNGGSGRYHTAAQTAAEWAHAPSIGTLDGDRTALLASGEGFADALAAGPVAAGAHFPLLLTTSDPSDATIIASNTMDDLGVDRVVVVGGSSAVDDNVVDFLRDRGFTVERWAGPTRDATAATVADNAWQRLGFQPHVTLLARGDAFPDALAASVQGGAASSPVLMAADVDTLGAATSDWLDAAGSDIHVIRALGGPGAVSDAVLGAAADAAAGGSDDDRRFSTEERASRDFPSGAGAAELARVDHARHEGTHDHDGFDRFVLELPGDPIAWSVSWDEEPITEAPSGEPVAVDGDAFLAVQTTASARWGDGDYDGPDRVTLDGAVATEAVMTQDFEGMLTWVVGLDAEAPFRVDVLDDPQRLVLDVAH